MCADWVKEDIKKDIKRFKKHPELMVASMILIVAGVLAIIFGWYWLNLPEPPEGFEYSYNYQFQGIILVFLGLAFLSIGFVVYSRTKVNTEE